MAAREDVEFLALLVHRGHLARAQAERLLEGLQRGEALERLLESEAGLEPEQVARLRRTRGGEIPEIPGYEILGKAGTGGTADVWRARDKKSLKVIALKVLRGDVARHEPTRKAFITEARLLERLRHPGLVAGYGVARSGTTYFSRMEFIEGSTLLELLDRGQAFDERAALRVVLEMASVLEYLSCEGVIHRDVKPGNIMLAHDGRMKLIDLGFAGRPEEQPAASDTTVGTVGYLAPEQCTGGAADLRSDIYSLGVTLFHLVVGRLPFESSDDREVLRMQVMEALSAPELKSRGLSHHLHYILEKMMAKDLSARYQSWVELTEDVRGQIEGSERLDYESEVRSRAARGPGGGARR
jgi:serine/threonine protein kinase